MLLGDRIADISVFRTAYSAYSPPALAQHVRQKMGLNPGLAIWDAVALEEDGFDYRAKHVLSEEQVTGLVRGASV